MPTAPDPSRPSESEDSLGHALPALIAAAQSGDRNASDRLFAANFNLLRGYIRRRAGSKLRARETTQDLAQSVCREVLKNIGGFEYRGQKSFENWLFTHAENKIRNRAAYWNREQRDSAREERNVLERLASFATPSRHMTTKERLDELELAFTRLPADYQRVILLSRVDGLPHREVAERMGRTISSTQNLLYRALGQLTDGLS